MNHKIFISHAVKDKEVASALVRFLNQVMDMPDGTIFCSSIPGEGIPGGENFVQYIKRELISDNVIVLPLLSQNYLRSLFSVCELGAAWGLERKWIPLMLPPLQHSDLTAVLSGIQVHSLNIPEHLGLLRDEVAKYFPSLPHTSSGYAHWENAKRLLMDRVSDHSNTPVATIVEPHNPDDHELNQTIEFYDKVAKHYDHFVSSDFNRTHAELNRFIARRLELGAPTTFLDLGGGTGKILSAFETAPNLKWVYCDASQQMFRLFSDKYGGSPVLENAAHKDAEEFLRTEPKEYDIILVSFLISSMSYDLDLNLLKRRLTNDGLLIIVEANPSYSETKPRFKMEDKVERKFRYTLKIKPVDAPSLATRAALVGLKIQDLISCDQGTKPYSYIATFAKADKSVIKLN